MNQIINDIDDIELLEFLVYLNKTRPGLPPIIREGLINLLVDSEADILENCSRTELEFIIRNGSNVIGIRNFDTERVLQCCFEEDITTRYPYEIDGIIRSGLSNIEYTRLLKQWMKQKDESC